MSPTFGRNIFFLIEGWLLVVSICVGWPVPFLICDVLEAGDIDVESLIVDFFILVDCKHIIQVHILAITRILKSKYLVNWHLFYCSLCNRLIWPYIALVFLQIVRLKQTDDFRILRFSVCIEWNLFLGLLQDKLVDWFRLGFGDRISMSFYIAGITKHRQYFDEPAINLCFKSS